MRDTYVNEFLNVSYEKLRELGVKNQFVNKDIRESFSLPSIQSTRVPELRHSYDRMCKYFSTVIDVIEEYIDNYEGGANNRSNKHFLKIINMLRFKEPRGHGLGYSTTHKNCNGWDIDNAEECAIRLYSQVKKNRKATGDKRYLSEMGLYSTSLIKGIGPDRHSDMIGNLIDVDLRNYTHRIIQELSEESGFNWSVIKEENGLYLPFIEPGYPLILLPDEIVSKQFFETDIMGLIYNILKDVPVNVYSDSDVLRELHNQEIDSKKIKVKDVSKEFKQQFVKSRNSEIIDILPKISEKFIDELRKVNNSTGEVKE